VIASGAQPDSLAIVVLSVPLDHESVQRTGEATAPACSVAAPFAAQTSVWSPPLDAAQIRTLFSRAHGILSGCPAGLFRSCSANPL
jgi:hypothetical protein